MLAVLLSLIAAVPASAHPAPFSYLDLEYRDDRIEGTLTVHAIDLAHELGIDDPATLFDERALAGLEGRTTALLSERLALRAGGEALPLRWTGVSPAADRDAVRLRFTVPRAPPAALEVDARLFDYDQQHQTFVTIYEEGELRQQFLFGSGAQPQVHYAGTAAGAWQVVRTFVSSGVEHILIGPDHVLFVIGLMLLGGSLRRLAIIVTSFTLGHSVTLALAVTGVLAPPAWLVEPAIALSIVIVGADNLLREEGARDLRGWIAFAFGLVHGFGFAFVLREFGLPDASLAWALGAFNVGVEIGQLAIVLPVAAMIAWLRGHSSLWARRVAVAGSLAVMAAGAYWFVDRVFLVGVG